MSEVYEVKQWDVFTENNELRLENDELQAESAKLRELVRRLVYATHPADRATLVANAAELGVDA